MMTQVCESRDFGTGNKLTAHTLGKLCRLEVHHLFPKALLYRQGHSRREVNAVANFTFLTQETNLEVTNRNNTPFTQAGGEEYLSFHLITEVMRQSGGNDWRRWFPTVRDKIVGVQNADGSWRGYHCITSRTFCTAAALLVLSSPYRYLPISDR